MSEPSDRAVQRRRLRLRVAQQREELALALAPLSSVTHALDRAASGVRWLRARPELMLGVAAAAGAVAVVVVASKPMRLVRLARFGVTAWQTWRWARIVLRPLGGSFRNL